jgi:hypothetical protein
MKRAVTSTLAADFTAAALDWIVPQWPAPDAVRAFVTTRNAGSSVEAYLPSAPQWLHQVHGNRVVTFATTAAMDSPHRGGVAMAPETAASVDVRVGDAAADVNAPVGDAAVTRYTGVVLAIRCADCLPVFLSDRDANVVGAAHAGWRGLAAGVIENTVEAMRSDPSRITAWLGPCIGSAVFEVGTDVREACVAGDRDAAVAFAPGRPGKWFADLETLARRRLARAGVTAVHGGGMCTLSDPVRFFSFRRDGTSGRMAALIWIDADGRAAGHGKVA